MLFIWHEPHKAAHTMIMKMTVKLMMVVLIWWAELFLIYPVLHESGHAFAALLLRKNVVSFSFWPSPYVEISYVGESVVENAIILLSGVVFPLLTVCFLRAGKMIPWMLTAVLVMSATNAVPEILYCLGLTSALEPEEDIAVLLTRFPELRLLILILLLAMLAVALTIVFKRRTVTSLVQFLS